MRAFVILLAACGSPPSHPVTGHGSGTPASPALDEVSLERTPCMGMCSVYKLTIARDGTVTVTGNLMEGQTPRKQVSPDGLAQIAAKIDEVKFFAYGPDGHIPKPVVCKDVDGGGQSCEMEGAAGCSDTSETILIVKRAGKEHKVTSAHCEPSPLDALEKLIDQVGFQ